jgi:pimeloyl-ACP methyl ester carboxylesterase
MSGRIAGACLALLAATASAAAPAPTRIQVNGVELHYVSAGSGDAVILLHAEQSDYRAWEPHMRELARSFHVVAYSRRYNFPNRNPEVARDHSAIVEAADLAALIKALRLKRVRLVGDSMGAAVALTLAIENPRMVHSLVLAEPPIFAWAREFPDGGALYFDFTRRAIEPARTAFAAGDDAGAMRLVVDGWATPGRFDRLSPQARLAVMQNASYFRVMSRSDHANPDIPREALRRLRIPVLVVTGEKTIEIHRRIDEKLARLIPRARSATIPNAGHESSRDNPLAFTEVVQNFFETNGR